MRLNSSARPWRQGILAAALLLSLGAAQAQSLDELGKSLTPVGAERKGNAAGTIPEWTGGIAKAPAGFNIDKFSTYPFADDKPLYTITAANMEQYKANLTPGQMELMRRYPTYKLNVYTTRRTAAYRQSVYDNAKAEAPNVKLVEGGNGVTGIKKSNIPFPIPKSGIEVIWNHIFRDLGGSVTRYSADFPVQSDGSFTAGKRIETISWASYMDNPEPNRILYFMNQITAPANSAGEVALVHEPINQVEEPRLAWQYNPGQRRVIRAPELAYDSPGIGADGLRTNDDLNGYNGAPDRYDWKLIGKKEMIVPYNNAKLADRSLKYTQIIGKTNINADLLRYELHRVWVVEANLKPGKRHIYAKRVFYVDEDSWAVLHADQYDARGQLWRVREVFGTQIPYVPTFASSGEVLYDLQARRYLVNALTNEEKQPEFGKKYEVSDFSSAALRRMGR
ncbi:MAG TPA: DUF1329 domain-containing protein [Limnobacter sp.]|uniref:DUF1329 domain-containing protein n=1 Tax=Limnobacter sp. TaxID=2003368 RepID=UPI002ED984E7